MKRASVCRRRNKLLVRSFSKTTFGAWIGCEPRVALDSNVSDQELGETVQRALDGSKTGVPHPKQDEWNDVLTRPLLRLAGVKSYSEFHRGAVDCTVEHEGGTLRFIPYENRGAREGFVQKTDCAFTIPASSSPEEVGAAVRKALDLSE